VKIAPFLLCVILLAACDPLADAPPLSPGPSPILGRWEYIGPLPDGTEATVRVQIVEGPFMRYIGYRGPSGPLSAENYARLRQGLEDAWPQHPELLVRWDGSAFFGLGGPTDGQVFFRHQPENNTLLSEHPDTAGITLQPVAEFSPIRFPSYEVIYERPSPTREN
jgi:hypothetical protein